MVMHEFGHVLGLADVSTQLYPDALMAEELCAGVRRLTNEGWTSNPAGVGQIGNLSYTNVDAATLAAGGTLPGWVSNNIASGLVNNAKYQRVPAHIRPWVTSTRQWMPFLRLAATRPLRRPLMLHLVEP